MAAMTSEQLSASRKKAPTLKDVAKAANVSLTTVSYVINGKGSISKEVTQRVMDVVDRLGYRPNKAAQAMKTGRSLTIGLVLPDFRYPLFPELANEIEKVCDNNQHSLIFANSYASSATEVRRVKSLAQMGIDGLIWFPGSQQDTIKEQVHHFPVIVIDRDLSEYDVVMPDHFAAGALQAEHLLTLGHRCFAIISGPTHVDNMSLRIKGARQAIANAGCELCWCGETDFSRSLSAPAVAMLSDQPQITAIIAGNDVIALNVINELERLGKKVPDDVSVVGFDDTSWCDLVTPPLTSIRMPLTEMAEEAFGMMKRRQDNPGAPRKKTLVGVTLTVRRSTGERRR